MSLLKRIGVIFQANANEVIKGVEDPKVSLDYSLLKLEESRNQVNRSLIEISAARKRLENQHEQLHAAVHKYHNQAQEAAGLGRDDLARKALERRQETLTRLTALEPNLENLDNQLGSLKESQSNLERKIALFRSKKEELKAIYDASLAQIRLKETVYGISKDLADIGRVIQRVEERIEEMRSRADAIEGLANEGVLVDVLEPGKDEVETELATIRRNRLIDEDLARLKNPALVRSSQKMIPMRDQKPGTNSEE